MKSFNFPTKAPDSRANAAIQRAQGPIKTLADNRPSAIAQRKLQEAVNANGIFQAQSIKRRFPNDSKVVPSIQRQVNSSIVQRVIKLEGVTWSKGQETEFGKKYGKETERIIKQIGYDIIMPPKTLAEALEDSRTINVEKHGKGSYSATATAFITEENGVRTREAGQIPEIMFRPTEGSEVMEVRGLEDCLAVYLLGKDKEGIAAVSGAHFVTPTCVDKKNKILNEEGTQLLTDLVDKVKMFEDVSAVTVQSDETGDTATRAENARRQVAAKLNELGVTDIKEHTGHRNVTYQLNPNGTAVGTWDEQKKSTNLFDDDDFFMPIDSTGGDRWDNDDYESAELDDDRFMPIKQVEPKRKKTRNIPTSPLAVNKPSSTNRIDKNAGKRVMRSLGVKNLEQYAKSVEERQRDWDARQDQ